MVDVYKSRNKTTYTLNSSKLIRRTAGGRVETLEVYVILSSKDAKDRLVLLKMGACAPDEFFESPKIQPDKGYIFWQDVNPEDARIILRTSSLVERVRESNKPE